MESNELRGMHKCVGVFSSHTQAENGVKELSKAGFDMKALSVVGRDYHTEEDVVGFYNAGDRVKYWGKLGAFWGGMFGILFAPAFFWIPGIGPILTGGIIGSAIMGMVEGGIVGAAVVGGMSVFGAALFSIGIPKDSVIAYERKLEAGDYLLIVHGTADEAARAHEILSDHGADATVYAAAE